jgi:flavin-dependent dehydrogenase
MSTQALNTRSAKAPQVAGRHDLTIVGGGLAGLTLALQLRQSQPDLDIAVIERAQYPVPEITHKVGESTVELGSWYLANTLGLRDHLDETQLRKFGLRFFFGAEGRSLEQADELGVSDTFSTPTWQLDRGRLENELAQRVQAAGVTLISGKRVTRVDLDGQKQVFLRGPEGEELLHTHWLIDAASRTSPLKRQLKLAQPNTHDINASWFRVEGEVRVDGWSTDPRWCARTGERSRWLSTNQLMGPGYWVWIIPLASGATSIGIVADPDWHPLEEIRTEAASLAWLERHEPRLANALKDHPLLDFAFLRHFSHDCDQLFSADRWALTGEAGVFLDPLYSPGTDFIAISNGFITDLVGRDRAGEDIRVRSRALETVYRSLYDNTLSIYQGLYGGFGDVHFMALKTTWDYCYYWSLLALLYTQGAMEQLADNAPLRNELLKGVALNRGLQRRFRETARRGVQQPGRGRFFNQQDVPLMGRLNAELNDRLSDEALLERVRVNVARLERLAGYLEVRMRDPRAPVSDDETALIGGFPRLLAA